MKFSAVAIVAAAVAGVGAVPIESGPIASLQARASDAIGGVVGFIKREEAGKPVVRQIKRSPIRFHSGLAHEEAMAAVARRAPSSPLKPFGIDTRKREVLIEARFSKTSTGEKRGGDLTSRQKAQESVPPLAPFSAGEK
ncbi:hypothetical protein CORC01_00797 [Colletotrichum orchidophilum]|uniref:Uncharacterized protein n=1 Tax=Colletotrichum orchidophilum TaxID=1209926 RepID=A0A1G4BRK6_9PEZI|nr:uncharacterized protein CORC01_00797 [Colletotrichum orchidophilum]OHF03935.1 hypothetical protein CORC01_00797 [Colletotrichum orchidophilum]